jgi:tetratricopeptide (TPR) repeat protein
MCAECHSTNVHKGYDPTTKTYTTTWSEIDVSCEACHGPGSLHVAWAEIPAMGRPAGDDGLVVSTSHLTARQEVELCAYCHSRRTSLGDYDHRSGDLLDYMIPQLLVAPLYFPDGQILDEVYVYGSFLQSKMYHQGVRCSDCHDVHSVKTIKKGNDLCLQCHRAKTYNTKDHHFHKEYHEGKPSDGWLCAKCHMPGRYYMGNDYRPDHSMRVPRPDLSAELGIPDACTWCHNDKPLTWSLDAYRKWYGIKRKPHYGEVIAAGRQAKPEAENDLIALVQDTSYPVIVRATALSLLAAYRSQASTNALTQALGNKEALMRRTALTTLRAIDPQERVRVVAPLLRDPVRAVRMEAARNLSEVPQALLSARQKEAFQSALEDYQKAMVYALDFAFAGLNLGNVHANLRQAEKAEAYYKAAIEVDDDFIPAKVNLAMLYNRMGRNAAAEQQLHRVLEIDPGLHEAAYSLGLLLAETHKYQEAVSYLERAAAGLPERPRVHYNLGLLLQRLGRVDEAETALLRAISIEPGNMDFLYAVADHYLKRRKLPEAKRIAERMISVHPTHQLGHDLMKLVERLSRTRQ